MFAFSGEAMILDIDATFVRYTFLPFSCSEDNRGHSYNVFSV